VASFGNGGRWHLASSTVGAGAVWPVDTGAGMGRARSNRGQGRWRWARAMQGWHGARHGMCGAGRRWPGMGMTALGRLRAGRREGRRRSGPAGNGAGWNRGQASAEAGRNEETKLSHQVNYAARSEREAARC
jgi:hypothetical protein